MTRKSYFFPLMWLCLLVYLPSSQAATVGAASCSQTDVQNAINSAHSGDTINVPGGSCTWGSGVTTSSSVAITLNGGGNTTISGTLTLNPTASAETRVTGFNFTANNGVVTTGSTPTSAFRVDHNNFTGGGTMLQASGNAPGLIDNNKFTGNAAAEMIHNTGLGASSAAGWSDSVTPGGPNMLFIEDNTFTFNATGNPAYFFGTSAIQSYYGARTVFRHNTLNNCQVDQHGTAGMIGARWWEIYDNTFTVAANGNQSNYMALRDGSGVVFDNHVTNPSSNGASGTIELTEDATSGSYPLNYQVGLGVNEAKSPAYLWGNDSSMTVGSGSSFVQAGRDYFVSSSKPSSLSRNQLTSDSSSTTYSYTPYTYPHPLQNGTTASGNNPDPPSNLEAAVQ
jgi:hypothetical protein